MGKKLSPWQYLRQQSVNITGGIWQHFENRDSETPIL